MLLQESVTEPILRNFNSVQVMSVQCLTLNKAYLKLFYSSVSPMALSDQR